MTVLRADDHSRAAGRAGKCRYQGSRRTDHELRLAAEIAGAGDDPGQLSFGCRKPVHLPVARDERSYFGCRHPITLSLVRLSDRLWQSQRLRLKPILLELQGVAPVTMVRAPRLG